MNTDVLRSLKREFQIVVEQMKIVFCPQDGIQQRAYDILQFTVPLKNLQSRLETEKQNHANFGDLDKLEILWADEQTKQKWYQKREQQEELLERLLIHNNLLLCFGDFIRYNSYKETLNPSSLLHHLLEFIAIDIRRYAYFPYLTITYEGIETLISEIKQFVNALRKQLPTENLKRKHKRLYSILLDLEEYQSIIHPQAELFAQEKAEFERQKQQWYQQQEELKRQQEAWLEEQKAELRQQQARLEEQKIALQRQQPTLLQPNIESFSPVKSDAVIDKKPAKNRQRLGWSPLLLLAVVIGILGGVQFLPKASVNSRKQISAMAENQPLELRLKSAQALAMKASEAVENPPLPLTAWREAQGKWEDAITVLQEMPTRQVQSEPVQKQLAIYQEDYRWASQKLIQEQTAIANFNSAKKSALEASVLVKNPPDSLEVWQQAEKKWQTAINLLETIPNDTFIAPQVQEKLTLYRLNSQEIEKRILMQKQADQQRQNNTQS
ncbi:hypothetical protein [Lyngbya sp. PCC 8106]|uniref:hypothetical protein n=1 Tax=Lyngbya sp. (strain PCC 8106) TaxID=313612 RepID=UPI0000EA90AF|nr:hypothetical protein [Lyngbya sp. PCC 8106]EAW34014.1 hypothetical protein L8106_27816 [Lyngbya sp. PCC 8106]